MIAYMCNPQHQHKQTKIPRDNTPTTMQARGVLAPHTRTNALVAPQDRHGFGRLCNHHFMGDGRATDTCAAICLCTYVPLESVRAQL